LKISDNFELIIEDIGYNFELIIEITVVPGVLICH